MKDLREIKEKIRQQLISGEYLFNMRTMDKEKLRKDILRSMEYIISIERLSVALEEREKIIAELIDEVAGFGPLSNLLGDAFVSEIMVNGPDNVYAEKNGMMALTDIKFESNRQLLQTIEKIMAPTQRRVDESRPLRRMRRFTRRLPTSNIVLPPLSLRGPDHHDT